MYIEHKFGAFQIFKEFLNTFHQKGKEVKVILIFLFSPHFCHIWAGRARKPKFQTTAAYSG